MYEKCSPFVILNIEKSLLYMYMMQNLMNLICGYFFQINEDSQHFTLHLFICFIYLFSLRKFVLAEQYNF